MRSHRRSSARFLSLVVATSLTSSARLAKADPDPPASSGHLAALNQPLGEETAAPKPLLAHHSQGANVQLVQQILNQDRAAHGASAISEDGDFGPETLTALKSFQKSHNLEQTGVVDAETWQQLEAVANGSASSTSTPASTLPASTVPAIPVPLANNAAENNGAAQRITTLTSGSNGAASDAKPASSPALAHAAMHLSAASLDTLARIIEAEAGVCSLEGKIAVGAVVLNRVRAGYADGTVLGVVKETGQFDGYNDSSYRGKPSADSVTAAKRAASGEDPSNDAFYYYNPYLVSPSWARTMKQTARIGTNKENTHRFMKP